MGVGGAEQRDHLADSERDLDVGQDRYPLSCERIMEVAVVFLQPCQRCSEGMDDCMNEERN